MVAFGEHHRQLSPEVVEDPGPKGKFSFEVRAVGRHPSVCFEQEIVPCGVINPRVVENHVGSQHAQFFGQSPGLFDNRHLWHTRVGVFGALEKQLHPLLTL